MCVSVSRGFGYVNFISEDDAERAAKMMHNFSLDGMYIKTKGPGVLRQEGYLDSDTHMKAKSLSPDYRPLTDCSFFMEERKCTKGKDVGLTCGSSRHTRHKKVVFF